MTDFYTVLRNALDRVGAADAGQRDRVYDHVREVMVRKLRNHRPPVGEAEIDSRINTFDAAIDRIEGELLEEKQAEEHARQTARERQQEQRYEQAPQYREPTQFEETYYDEPDATDPDWDDQADAANAIAPWEYDAPAPEPMWGAPAIDMAWDESSSQWHDARHFTATEDESNGAEAPWPDEAPDIGGRRGGRRLGLFRRRRGADRRVEPNGGIEAEADAAWPSAAEQGALQAENEPRRARPASGLFRRLRPSRRPRRDDGVGDIPLPEPDADEEPRRRSAERRQQSLSRGTANRGDPIAEMASRLDARGVAPVRAEPLLLGPPAMRAESPLYLPSPDQVAPTADEGAPPSRRRTRRSRRTPDDFAEPEAPERRTRRGRQPSLDDLADEEEVRPARSRRRDRRRPKPDDLADVADQTAPETRRRPSRLWIAPIFVFAAAVFVWAGYVLMQVLSGSDSPSTEQTADATATADASGAAAATTTAGASIRLFQGDDPTVFEAGADNPVRYQGDAGGAHVRITSSISSGGARAIIGPGVANRIAGHQVRFVIEARGTPGQAAQAVRFAYKRGDTTLEWRVLRLLSDFAVLTPTWDIPADGGNGNDYLLIEPGVPGDGTALDIRSIRIDVLD